MSTFKTEQEAFWHGQFGDDYVARNKSQELLSSKVALFAKILGRAKVVNSAIEFGSNIGLNLFAVKTLLPNCEVSSIEINEKAAGELKERYSHAYGEDIRVYNQSILEWDVDYQRELSIISGVLIHINPDELKAVYKKLYDASTKYISICEYYNPTPVEVTYRGHEGKLFKRDWAGEILDMYPDLRLVDYGFVYHRDNIFPQDDATWFLLEKI
ncbi:MAG: hypothetical protein FWB91_06255 [Defluviitaleaceae bacterium]|nr:hypothetical protein [Defluviitaleaceae bacterium]